MSNFIIDRVLADDLKKSKHTVFKKSSIDIIA